MSPIPSPNCDLPAPDLASEEGLERILASIDSMAAQRPVAAHIVTATNSDDVSARELSRLLATDVTLAGRVMKLANSATFGMRGRVDSLQFAVTVVGFTTVRTMATVALTDLDDESRLPQDFWTTTTRLALAASAVAPRFGQRAQDALCVGLLAELGTALLHHNDPDGQAETGRDRRTPASRRAAERQRYGMAGVELSAVALDRWSFPLAVILPMEQVEAAGALEGAVLRVAYELAARLADEDYAPQSMARLSCGRLGESDVAPILAHVRQEAGELRRAILGE
jgi:HD-like signal output (HDOD) protein